MKRHFSAILFVIVLGQAVALASQQAPAPPTPGVPVAPRAPQAPAPPVSPKAPAVPAPPAPFGVDPSAGGQPINIRVDVTLIDQTGNAAPQPKTVMVMLADRAVGQTRSVFEDRIINIDARPELRDGRIRINVTVQSAPLRPAYFPVTPEPEGNKTDHTLDWRNSFSLLLENGKPMLALESSDQARNRKLSLEVKATIQK